MTSTGSPSNHLLRVEGVNLGAVLYDTSSISVRRGAGLMLRQAVRDMAQRFALLKPVSIGASVGVFEFFSDTPETVVADCAAMLNQDSNYRWLTFVVDCAPLAPGFASALQQVIAANRLRQFRQATLLPPGQSSQECCGLDRLRPAGAQRVNDKPLSDSAHARYQYGRQQRQRFYNDELDEQRTLTFTDDLSELSLAGRGQQFGNLNGKMAVIHLDGNRFGKIQRACDSAASLRRFDHTIQGYRRDFLRQLLDLARNAPSFFNGDHIRLETLLWGGDEILLVVPAWQGMAVLQLFFDVSADWSFEQHAKQHAEQDTEPCPLTHAAGMVFCHHKTPIAQAARAAEALTESVKDGFNDHNPPHNAFDYLVLESMSYPVGSLTEHWRDYYGERVKSRLPPLRPFSAGSAAWSQQLPTLRDELASLPRGALYAIATDWVNCWRNSGTPSNADLAALQQRLARFRKVSGDATYTTLFTFLFGYFNPHPPDQAVENQHLNPAWLHLVELWDYLAPEAAA